VARFEVGAEVIVVSLGGHEANELAEIVEVREVEGRIFYRVRYLNAKTAAGRYQTLEERQVA